MTAVISRGVGRGRIMIIRAKAAFVLLLVVPSREIYVNKRTVTDSFSQLTTGNKNWRKYD